MKIRLDEYVVSMYFLQYSPHSKKMSNGTCVGKCTHCNEGFSFSTKTRLYYIATENYIYCHNCQRSWTPINWIKEVSGLSIREILKEIEQYDYGTTIPEEEEVIAKDLSTKLPYNSINLEDPQQLEFYKDNKIVQMALNIIKTRRLDTAINRSTSYYLSLEDFIHKNRLIIPFFDRDNRVLFYQTRAMLSSDADRAKYLSKMNSDKRVFGLNNVDENLEYLFIFEGPIDAMFVKNGVSMAGLQITKTQTELMSEFMLHKKIWILDNQLENEEVLNKNIELVERGETVFIWPKNFSKYKDVNELCCDKKVDYITPEFFIRNSHSGLKAKVMLKI